MPIQSCIKDGKPAYKWGDKGKAYAYKLSDKAGRARAKNKAIAQGKAIKSKNKGD